MNDVIQILGERWTYVYSSMYYGLWEYNKETNVLSTNNQVSFTPEELNKMIEDLEEEAKRPDADSNITSAIKYLQKIQEKL